MTITPFGLVFMTLGFTLLAVRRAWLLPLLVVSAGLHAFAVVIIGPVIPGKGLGVSPWLFTCSLIFVHLVVVIKQNGRIELGDSREVRLIFLGWMIYMIWCVFSAFTLPFIFAGLQVNTLARWDGFAPPPESMKWTFVNGVQAFNTVIVGMVLLYLQQIINDVAIVRRFFVGFLWALGVTVALSMCQRLEYMNIIPAIDLFNASLNPSYQQNSMLNYYGGPPYLRLNWPFSEPSYASVWYGSIMVGGISMFLLSNRIFIGLLLAVFGVAGLLNGMGGSGLGGGALGIMAMLVISTVCAMYRKNGITQIVNKFLLGIGFCLLLFLVYLFIQKNYPNMPNYLRLLEVLAGERFGGHDLSRVRSNIEALSIVRNTWGLGAGLGSNRASSYLLSMLSNIGIPGFFLFMTLFFYQLFSIFKNDAMMRDMRIVFFMGGAIGCFFSMSLGIPDMNFPAWWIWVLACFGVLASRSSLQTPK